MAHASRHCPSLRSRDGGSGRAGTHAGNLERELGLRGGRSPAHPAALPENPGPRVAAPHGLGLPFQRTAAVSPDGNTARTRGDSSARCAHLAPSRPCSLSSRDVRQVQPCRPTIPVGEGVGCRVGFPETLSRTEQTTEARETALLAKSLLRRVRDVTCAVCETARG